MSLRYRGQSGRIYSAWQTWRLGAFGYAWAFVQILAFAVGGFIACAELRGTPYCDRCRRYLGEEDERLRFAEGGEPAAAFCRGMAGLLASGDPAAGLHRLESYGHAECGPNDLLRLFVWVARCESCGLH